MKPYEYIKIALAVSVIVCLYLIALSDRYYVMNSEGDKIFDKWECCVKYMEVGKNGFYEYHAIQEEMTVSVPENVEPVKTLEKTPEDHIRKLYDALSKEYNLGDYNTFTKQIQDPALRRKAYDTISKKYNVGTFEEYETKLGFSPNKPEERITR